MSGPKETVYDEQIDPLMKRIIALCKEHQIQMVASFALDQSQEDDSQVMCSTFIEGKDWKAPAKLHKAMDILQQPAVYVTVTEVAKKP